MTHMGAFAAELQQQVAAELESMNETIRRTLTKETINERRLMSDNIKPHELIRMIMIVLDEFEPSGDVYWPLRQIRDHVLDYLRAVSVRYPNMSGLEKAHLCRLITYEAARRQLEGLEGKQLELEKLHFVVKVMGMVERGENRNCDSARLFTSVGAEVSTETLRRGYREHASFHFLREYGRIEAHFEAQTFLPHEVLQAVEIDDELKEMQKDYLAHEEAQMSQAHEAQQMCTETQIDEVVPEVPETQMDP